MLSHQAQCIYQLSKLREKLPQNLSILQVSYSMATLKTKQYYCLHGCWQNSLVSRPFHQYPYNSNTASRGHTCIRLEQQVNKKRKLNQLVEWDMAWPLLPPPRQNDEMKETTTKSLKEEYRRVQLKSETSDFQQKFRGMCPKKILSEISQSWSPIE